MTQLGIEISHRLAAAKALLARHGPDDYDRIAQDFALLGRIAELNVVELTALVDSVKARDGEARSVALYRLWISVAANKPDQVFAAQYNLGVHLSSLGATAQALDAYRAALAAKPNFHQAAINAGLCQEELGDPEAALRTWIGATQDDEVRTALLNHTGRLLEGLKRYEDAERNLLASLLTNPDQPDVIHHWTGIRAKTCAWPVFLDLPGLPRERMAEATGALATLALTDDTATHARQNRAWIDKKLPAPATRLSPPGGYAHERLRIGYMSSDYCMHPMAFLMADLLEQHDRTRFEVYGYCSTKEDGSDVRRRVLGAFDKLTSIAAMSDEAAAQAIRADEIDVLVDLNGLTLGTRMGALRWRPAPLQVTYLGYNGAIPLDELDYIIADRFVIPPAEAAGHRPPPLYLPGCYQANDRKLPIAPKEARRAAGLPEGAFVFCCFSNNYKITEEMFGTWMAILRRTENTVLWLYADSEVSRRNLARRAAAAGFDERRVLFAPRAEPHVYRSRLALADLFLDTFPYNAGTTASDALRVGLPLVTLAGRSFASRMAGSLLHATGLGECVADTPEAYADLAVALAHDPERHGGLRARLEAGAWDRTLGDTPGFARAYEDALLSVAVRASPTGA